jgi:nucleoside-diphosphate-sugar epimerase
MISPVDVCQDQFLVTGASGFLGSELVRQMVLSGFRVRGTGRRNSYCGEDIDYLSSDILDGDGLRPAIRGVNTVIHAAGLAHVFDKISLRSAPFELVNEVGTSRVATVAAEEGVRHLIMISSVAVYGGCHDGLPCNEESPCKPEGPYATSKWQAERRASEIAKNSQMRLSILRLTTLYGEGDPGNIARLIRLIDRGRFVSIGTGQNRKSLMHKEDAARACLRVAASTGTGINIYNVSGSAYSMRVIVKHIASALGRSVPRYWIPASIARGATSVAARLARNHGPFGTAEMAVRKWLSDDVYDSHKFERDFTFQARVGLAEGLRREVAWYRQGM